jgi:hypothetical protein
MNWERTREALGSLGVAASLVFVGLEIRQNTAAQRGKTRQELEFFEVSEPATTGG